MNERLTVISTKCGYALDICIIGMLSEGFENPYMMVARDEDTNEEYWVVTSQPVQEHHMEMSVGEWASIVLMPNITPDEIEEEVTYLEMEDGTEPGLWGMSWVPVEEG